MVWKRASHNYCKLRKGRKMITNVVARSKKYNILYVYALAYCKACAVIQPLLVIWIFQCVFIHPLYNKHNNYFLDLDNSPSPAKGEESVSDEEEDSGYDLTSPVSSFLERSRKQVERYFRRLTQPEPPQNGKKLARNSCSTYHVKNGPTPATFSFIFVFSNKFYNK